jgi:DNA-binding transcriptional regulator YhcF (GntR family)
MLIKVDLEGDVPIYAQITAEIRSAIAHGRVVEGERLPAARTLAASLGVNMHTVLRAYAQLKDEGLVHMRRGAGAVVREGGRRDAGRLEKMAARLASYAREQGLSRDDLVALIQRM